MCRRTQISSLSFHPSLSPNNCRVDGSKVPIVNCRQKINADLCACCCSRKFQFIKRSLDHLPSRYIDVSNLFTRPRKILVFVTSSFFTLGVWVCGTCIVFQRLFTLFVPQAFSVRGRVLVFDTTCCNLVTRYFTVHLKSIYVCERNNPAHFSYTFNIRGSLSNNQDKVFYYTTGTNS